MSTQIRTEPGDGSADTAAQAAAAAGAVTPELAEQEPPRSIASAKARQSNGRFMRVVPSMHGPLEEGALPEDRFLDREISWLQFNERVLQLAGDETVPLLERARYLSIFASNLDEFFMVRVAGL